MELLTEEELAKVLEEHTKVQRSRAYYRHKALHGDKVTQNANAAAVGEAKVSPEEAVAAAHGKLPMNVGFMMGTQFTCLENVGKMRIPVCRKHGKGKITVFYKTREHEAKQGEDFVHKEGRLVFEEKEVLKYIEIQIVRLRSFLISLFVFC